MTRDYQRTRAFRAVRAKVLERDRYTCRRCGRHKSQLPERIKLTAAHIIPRALGGPDTESNLITLCSVCHGKADGGRRYRRR